MGYSVTLKQDEEEVYWCDWGSGIGELLDHAFLGDFRLLDGRSGSNLPITLFWGLSNLVGNETYLKQRYPDCEYTFLNLCEHLFKLWVEVKANPEATLTLSY